MPERTDNESRRIEISVAQVVASALAAVSSAFLLSKLGAAGTVIGAAIASVVATVGSALYVHVFRRTSEQLRDVRAQMGPNALGVPAAAHDAPLGRSMATPAAANAGADDATRVLPVFDPSTHGAEPLAETAGREPVPVPEPSRTRTWLVRSGIAAVAVFAIAMASITVVELGMGRSFASLFGNGGAGSTIGDFTDGGHKSTPEKSRPETTPENKQGTSEDSAGTSGSTPSPGASTGTPSGGATGKQDPTGGSKPPTGSSGTPTPSTTPPTTTPSTSSSGGATSPPAGDNSGASPQGDRQQSET